MGVSTSGFTISQEIGHDQPDFYAIAGDGGSVMDSWTGTDETLVNNLLVGNFTNKSSYSIPAVIVEGNDTFMNFQEIIHGAEETGVEVGYTYLGTRFSGTAKIGMNIGDDDEQVFTVEGINLETTNGDTVFTATADSATGEYDLPVAEGGDYTITVTHPALDGVEQTYTLSDGESQPDTDFKLPVPSGGSGGLVIGGNSLG